MMADKEDQSLPISLYGSMEKLLKVNSSHAACVQASNGIMVMGKNSSFISPAYKPFSMVQKAFFKKRLAA
jgi:hypothetical protein